MIRYLIQSPKSKRLDRQDDLENSRFGEAIANASLQAREFLKMAAWLSLPIGLLGLLPSIFLLQVYNRVLARGGSATLIAMVAGVLCFLALELFLRRKRAKVLREAGASLDYEVSNALMESMLRRPLLALENRSTSQWLQLFRDVGAMRSSISGGLSAAILDLPMAALALVVVGIIALPVLPVLLVAMIILATLAWWWADEVRTGRVEEHEKARSLDHHTAEICNARATLKVLGHDETARAQWQKSYDNWLTTSFTRNGELENARETSTVLLTFFSVAVITVGAVAINFQWMSIGSLMAVNLLASKALAPIAQLAGNWRSLARANEAAKRLQSVLEEPVEPAASGIDLPRPQGLLRLEQVSFSYPGGKPALADVSLQIGPSGLHAIVGRNGAGKSTLGKLLAGLYRPQEGRIFIGEYDLAQFSRPDIGQWVGCLAQEVYWFGGKIIDNLRMVKADASDSTIIATCQLAGAHAFISRLPHGYQTELGDGGVGLSAGELRKLALAQLFLRNPSVLILDEPSNDLDFDSETALIQTLQHIARIHTVIVITHSVRMAAAASHIYHVKGDSHIEHGSAQQMLPQLFGQALSKATSMAPQSQNQAAAQKAATHPAETKA